MKEICLTRNKVALVDDADYEWLMQWKWQAVKSRRTWYAQRGGRLPNGKKTIVRMHRQILGLERNDPREGDHFNGDGLDNRRSNLRVVTHAVNNQNVHYAKGYRWNRREKKYVASLGKMHIGYFTTAEGAQKAHLEARKVHYGLDEPQNDQRTYNRHVDN